MDFPFCPPMRQFVQSQIPPVRRMPPLASRTAALRCSVEWPVWAGCAGAGNAATAKFSIVAADSLDFKRPFDASPPDDRFYQKLWL